MATKSVPTPLKITQQAYGLPPQDTNGTIGLFRQGGVSSASTQLAGHLCESTGDGTSDGRGSFLANSGFHERKARTGEICSVTT